MVDPAKIEACKRLARNHYDTWGQWVVECHTDEDIERDLININGDELTLEEYISLREDVAGYYREIENTAW